MTLPSPISNRAPSKTTGAAASRDWDSRPAAAASIMQTPQISSLIRRIAFLLDPGRMCTGGRRGPPQRIVLCVSDSSATPGGLPVAAFEGFQPDFVVVEHSPHHPGLLDVRALVIVGLVADRHDFVERQPNLGSELLGDQIEVPPRRFAFCGDSPLEFHEPCVHLVEPRINLVEPYVNLLEPRINLLEPCVNLLEPRVNLLEPCVDPLELSVDLRKLRGNFGELFLHMGELLAHMGELLVHLLLELADAHRRKILASSSTTRPAFFARNREDGSTPPNIAVDR